MKVQVKNSAKCQKTLEISVPQEKVQEEFSLYYAELKKTAEVPGFRKGKAPRELLEKHFADKAHDKVLTNLISKSYYQAIEKEQIHAVTHPQFSQIQFKAGEALSFQATVDIRPEFELKDYKKIKLNKKKIDIGEDEIAKIMTYLQERYAQFVPVEGRAVEADDFVICDYRYSVDGVEVDKRDNIWLGVNNELFVPGLGEKLVGMNAAQTKEFTLMLPKKFKPEQHANKEAKFTVTIKEIKRKKLPDLNDDLAKMIGKQTLEELKEHVRTDLVYEKETQREQDMKAQVIEALLKGVSFDVPAALAQEREQSLIESARKRMKQQGIDEAQIEAEIKKMADMFSQEAVRLVRTFFMLESIAHKENIKVTDEEMNERIEQIARAYNQKKEEVLRYLSEKHLLENIHWELWEKKVINFLIEQADVTENSAA